MKMILWLSLAMVIAGCAPVSRSAAPTRMPRTVTVLAVNNRIGADLMVAGTSILEKYALRSDRLTVADVLAYEAAAFLERSGIKVAAASSDDGSTEHGPDSIEAAAALAKRQHIEGDVLYIELRRWEADAPFHPTSVIAALSATVIDAGSGEVVWKGEWPLRPLPTPGAVSEGDAYAIAARAVIDELLAPLRSQR